jgi:hypothetical protein
MQVFCTTVNTTDFYRRSTTWTNSRTLFRFISFSAYRNSMFKHIRPGHSHTDYPTLLCQTYVFPFTFRCLGTARSYPAIAFRNIYRICLPLNLVSHSYTSLSGVQSPPLSNVMRTFHQLSHTRPQTAVAMLTWYAWSLLSDNWNWPGAN